MDNMSNNNNIRMSVVFIPVNGTHNGLLNLTFSFPTEMLESLGLNEIIERIHDQYELVTEGSPNLNVRVGISSSYVIHNTQNNESRLFHGHFSFENNNLVMLANYQNYYSRNMLLDLVRNSITPENLESILIRPYLSSIWTYGDLRRISVVFQIYCSSSSLSVIDSCTRKPINKQI